MPPPAQFTPISHEQHSSKAWRRPTGYSFAEAEASVPIVGSELANAAPAMPLAFMEQEGRFLLVAVLSLMPGRNLFVAPDGRWLGAYVPAMFRTYPFRLLRKQNSEEWVFCILDDAKALVDAGEKGEPFFDSEGNLTPITKSGFEVLADCERSRGRTDAAVSALAEAGVIHPWGIRVKDGDKEQNVSGLFCVDEAAMNALSDDAFLRLRKASALPIAYAQLMSMGQLSMLERLAKLERRTTRPVPALPESLDKFLSLPTDDVVHFS
jgi:hypothetical protein